MVPGDRYEILKQLRTAWSVALNCCCFHELMTAIHRSVAVGLTVIGPRDIYVITDVTMMSSRPHTVLSIQFSAPLMETERTLTQYRFRLYTER